MNDLYYIEAAQLNILLRQLRKDYKVFSPVVQEAQGKEKNYFSREFGPEDSFVFNAYRSVEPLKTFFTYPSEKVTDYFTAESGTPNHPPSEGALGHHLGQGAIDLGVSPQKDIIALDQKIIILGVKNCDLVGHKVQDFVFLEGVEVDALYRVRRENIIFISGDCTDFKQVCHCLAWEIFPYPAKDFDLNLSPLNDGYIVEVGSPRARELLEKYNEFFTPAKETQSAARQQKRDNLAQRLKKHLLVQNLVSRDKAQELMRRGFNLDTWSQFMQTCVECGGCNLICDTCHCFLLSDQKKHPENVKVRVWDSCLYGNYARVAGGANPLRTRAARLRNRFIKKFDFFMDNLGMPACCGCGRCIEVCPGKIDIREVLKDLDKKLSLPG